MNETENLKKEIADLKQKLENSQKHGCSTIPTIIKEVVVAPRDYESLKAKAAYFETEHKKFADFLKNGQGPSIRKMIGDFEKKTRHALEEIIEEFSFVSCGRDERVRVLELTEYLREVVSDLDYILDVKRDGKE